MKFLLFGLGDPRDLIEVLAALKATEILERVLRLEVELRSEPDGDDGREGRAGYGRSR